MLKKYSIITILLFAYTIVLGHSIIPHHHHHNDSHETKQSEHHHHSDHENDHHDNDDESLADDFENYIHSGDTQDLHQQPDIKIVNNVIATAYIISFFEFKINAIESPPPVVRLSNNCIPLAQHCLSTKGLRAPPCDLV
jgi:hypothetical protein